MGSPPIPDRDDRSPDPEDQQAQHHLANPSAINFSPPKKRAGGLFRGKEQAIQDGTYPGAITYRHLSTAGGTGGVMNPLRCVAHIDIDAAYAAMEMVRLKVDPSVPLAVQQWNGLIAVNYPARKFGISRMETPQEAVQKCPHIMLVHCATYRQGDLEPGYWPNDVPHPDTHKISLDYYRRESLKIIKVFGEFCPVVEKASIDESFLDLSIPVRDEILKRWPSLAKAPEGASGGLDSELPSPYSMGIRLDWKVVGNLIPKTEQAKPKSSPVKGQAQTGAQVVVDQDDVVAKAKEEGEQLPVVVEEDEESAEEEMGLQIEEEIDATWSDVALFLAAEIVMKCRTAVHERLGYTCSAGVAPNKMLAKLCSAWKKPNAQTVLRFSAVQNFLRPMKFQKIRNLGGKLGNSIAEAYEAQTVGDLLLVSIHELQRKMGEDSGMWVWEIIRGLDFSEVEAKTQVKSMISSKNFRPSISRYADIAHWISILGTELHLRLVEARDRSPGLWPKTINFSHRSENYVVRSHQIAFPFTSRLDVPYLQKFGERLLKIAIGAGERLTAVGPDTKIGPYSNMMLSLTGLERLESGQEGIERFFGAGTAPPLAPEGGKDRLRVGGEKPQEEKEKKEKRKTAVVENAADKGKIKEEVPPSKKFKKIAKEGEPVILLSSERSSSPVHNTGPPPPSYTCPRCKRVIKIPEPAIQEARKKSASDVESAFASLLEKEKAEHVDYHFARDMLEKERKVHRGDNSGSSLSSGVGKRTAAGSKNGKPAGSLTSNAKTKSKSGDSSRQQTLKGFFGKR
ncbi:DNA/RNA polymerase [Meredithblackwellia eburnea MCA 4105]